MGVAEPVAVAEPVEATVKQTVIFADSVLGQ